MRRVIFIFVAIFGFSYAQAVAIQEIELAKGQALEQSDFCDIKISFGSYSSGIDHGVEQKTRTYLKSSSDLKDAYEWPWGLEGETDLCLKLKMTDGIEKVFNDLKNLIPGESKRGWTSIKQRGKPAYRNRLPKE